VEVRRNATRVCLWAFLGSLLLQTAWILAVPPFRAIDEFDHAYRAAAVADGQWVAPGALPAQGRGELVRVPASIVADANPACAALGYTGRDNCNPVDQLGEGQVTVASAASRYNPVFYWVIGSAAERLEGADALYVMRAVGALLSSLLIAGAAWVTTRWARTWWPLIGLAAALTPVTIYSTSVAAPNGVEVTAALGVWMALLGLQRLEPADQGPLIVAAALFAVPLAVVRGLGPVWLASILAVWLVGTGLKPALTTLSRHRKLVAVCSAIVVSATAAASVWTMAVGSMELDDNGPFPDPVVGTLSQLPVWFLQSIAAFPLRNEPAPTFVYAAGGIVIASLIGLGAWRSSGGTRRALLATSGLALGIPLALQMSTYVQFGSVWQGRYGWPLSMGVLLLAAAALDDSPAKHRLVCAGLRCAAALWLAAHTASTVDVSLQELGTEIFTAAPLYWTTSPWLVGMLSVLGTAAWVLMVRDGAPRAEESAVPVADPGPRSREVLT
jgi:hypothetical protein